MVACRRTRIVAAMAGLALIALATPVSAHGALQSPPSRAVNCDPRGGPAARSGACRAAAAVAGGASLAEWDEIRVADVRGRDKDVIPDGKLCSAGIGRFRGLDLARPDWPAARLSGGASFTFRYRVSIPHRGSFKLYVTRDGFTPTKALTWSALEPAPFLKVTDPPRRNGSYVFSGRLPKGRTGRHMIYTIWQTSDTPDTYYSCSDVVFTGARAGGVNTPQNKTAAPVPATPTTPATPATPAPPAPPVQRLMGLSGPVLLAAGGGTVVLLAIAAGACVGLARWLRVRREF